MKKKYKFLILSLVFFLVGCSDACFFSERNEHINDVKSAFKYLIENKYLERNEISYDGHGLGFFNVLDFGYDWEYLEIKIVKIIGDISNPYAIYFGHNSREGYMVKISQSEEGEYSIEGIESFCERW